MNETGAPRAAIIGSGMCGTGYLTQLLRANGISAGHEDWFRPVPGRLPGLDVDVSWLAMPDIESGLWTGPTVTIIRNPVDTVRSLAYLFDQTHAPYVIFARDRCPKIRDSYGTEAAVEFWVDWNQRCAAISNMVINLEGLEDALAYLAKGLEIRSLSPAPQVSKTVNSKESQWSAVDPDYIWELLGGRAEQFGYTP